MTTTPPADTSAKEHTLPSSSEVMESCGSVSPSSSSSGACDSVVTPPFPFPFPPYAQQIDLMTHVFNTIEKGKGHVAIVESPTGTGE